jgi:hypothetical protein
MNLSNLHNIINFKNLISVNRIFEVKPSSEGDYLYLSYFFLFLIIAGTVVYFIPDKSRKIFKKLLIKLTYFLFFVGTIGLILIALRWQGVAYAGSRFVMYSFGLISLYWLLNIIVYRYKVLPKESQAKKEKEKFEKYLPKNYKKSYKKYQN